MKGRRAMPIRRRVYLENDPEAIIEVENDDPLIKAA